MNMSKLLTVQSSKNSKKDISNN